MLQFWGKSKNRVFPLKKRQSFCFFRVKDFLQSFPNLHHGLGRARCTQKNRLVYKNHSCIALIFHRCLPVVQNGNLDVICTVNVINHSRPGEEPANASRAPEETYHHTVHEDKKCSKNSTQNPIDTKRLLKTHKHISNNLMFILAKTILPSLD